MYFCPLHTIETHLTLNTVADYDIFFGDLRGRHAAVERISGVTTAARAPLNASAPSSVAFTLSGIPAAILVYS